MARNPSGFGPVSLDVSGNLDDGDTESIRLAGRVHDDVGDLAKWFGRRKGLDGIRVVNESGQPLRLIAPGDANPRVPNRTTGAFGVTDGSTPSSDDPAIRSFGIENIGNATITLTDVDMQVMNGNRRTPQEQPRGPLGIDIADAIPGVVRRG